MVTWLLSYGGRVLAACACVVGLASACSSSDDPASSSDAGSDDALDPPIGDADASVSDASPSDAGAPPITASFRVAHLAADVGPVDVCYRTSPSAAFVGPLVTRIDPPDAGAPSDARAPDGGDAATLPPPVDAGSPGLSFPAVSAYFSVPIADGFEIAIVGAADRSCAAPRARGKVTLSADHRLTVAFVGLSSAAAGSINELGLATYVDDPTPDPKGARSRFVNAALGTLKVAPSDALAISVSTSTGEIAVAPRVEPRETTTPTPTTDPTPVDALGYHTAPLIPFGAFVCRHLGDGGGSWATGSRALGMAGGSIHTGFIVSDSKATLGLLWCDDLASSCAIVK